jgi:hypothetical protein
MTLLSVLSVFFIILGGGLTVTALCLILDDGLSRGVTFFLFVSILTCASGIIAQYAISRRDYTVTTKEVFVKEYEDTLNDIILVFPELTKLVIEKREHPSIAKKDKTIYYVKKMTKKDLVVKR